MLKRSTVLIAAIVIAVTSIGAGDEPAGDYKAIMDRFFQILGKDGSGPAIDYLFSSSPWAEDQKMQIEQLRESHRLREITGEEAREALSNYFGEPPPWFAPGEDIDYEVWVDNDESRSNFRVIVDKYSGRLFLTDYVV